MTIDSEEGVVETPETETEETETETESTEQEEHTEAEKPKETSEQRIARLERQLSRERKKLGLDKDEERPAKQEKETRQDDLGYGEKAFLRSYDIKGSDELALVKDWQKRTGDALDVVVEDDIFQAKLTKLREARATAEATPRSTRRSAQVASDDVSYWRTKIETGQATLNDIPDVTVRRKVLNARIDNERTGTRFSDTPIQMT